MYLISGNITSNVTGNLLVITGNGNIGNITSNFRTLAGIYVAWRRLNVNKFLFFCLVKIIGKVNTFKHIFRCI